MATWFAVFWLVLAIILGVFEAVTVQLVAVWFALGSLAAIVPSLMGGSVWMQFGIFVLVSFLALAATRPFVQKMREKPVHTNADSLIGQVGIVMSECIDPSKGMGRVSISGQDWAACTEDGSIILKDEHVLVKGIVGVKLIVEAIG